MGLWRWIRDVIADRGEQAPVEIHLERTRGGEYAFRLGVRAGFGGQDVARIPVARRLNDQPHPLLKEVFSCEVAGRTLEAANVFALQRKAAAAIDAIAPARTLPLAYFRIAAIDLDIPVYEEGDDVVTPLIGGPKLKGQDLAAIRTRVCRYLVSSGYAASDDDVSIRVLRPRDLRLVTAAAVLRSIADAELWMPAVEGVSADGPVVGVLANAARVASAERRRASGGPLAQDQAPAAVDLISLLRMLRAELDRSGRAPAADGLHACEVQPEIWTVAEARTTDTRWTLAAYLSDGEATELELAVRRTGTGDLVTAIEDRGISVFLERDRETLALTVGRYLHASGFLRFVEEVEIHPPERPRSERLAADAIRTTGDAALLSVGAAGDDREEVEGQWQQEQ